MLVSSMGIPWQAPEELINLFKKNRALYTTTRGADKLHLPRLFTDKRRLSFRVLYTTIYSPRELEEHLVLPDLNIGINILTIIYCSLVYKDYSLYSFI